MRSCLQFLRLNENQGSPTRSVRGKGIVLNFTLLTLTLIQIEGKVNNKGEVLPNLREGGTS